MEMIVIHTYKELVKHIKRSKKKADIYIGNFEFPFGLDLCELLLDTDFCKKNDEESTLTLIRPLIIDKIKCKTLHASYLRLDNANTYFLINDSDIDKMELYSCKLSSLSFVNADIEELNITDCSINGETDLWLASKQITNRLKINIEDTHFGGSLKVSNLLLIRESELNILGGNSIISGDLIISDIRLLGGCIDIRGDINQNLCFNYINYQGEEYLYKKPLNYGKIKLQDVTIGNELIFLHCHIGELEIINSTINGLREYTFSYDRIRYGAAVALRDCALKKNDIVLSEKYTTELFNATLKKNAVRTYKRWATLIESKPIKRETGCVKWFYKYVREPIELLIPSVTSSEGILLWLNKYSNNYNRSWVRGIVFTLIITLISYIILNFVGMEQPYFIFDIHCNGYGEVVKGYLSLLDVFNLTGIADKIKFELTTWGYIILFMSKVFITYGFWQTIYAFYKYRK